MLLVAHLARGIVLRHNVDVGVGTEFASDPLHDLVRAGNVARHDQMAEEEAAQRQSVLIHYQRSDLAVHFLDSAPGRLRVIGRAEIAARHLRIPELEVWHIDVNQAVHQFQRIERVVGAGVVNERQPQSALNRDQQRLQDLGHHMLGRHKVDVVAAALL